MALAKQLLSSTIAPDGSTYVTFTDGNGNLNPSTGFNYTHINSATNTAVKSGAGMLHTITINTPLGAVTVYDNTAASGTVIAVISASAIGTLVFDVNFSTGLTITTASANDMTVSYR